MSPPSGSTASTVLRLISAADWLMTCTPSCRSRPACAEHTPVDWNSAGDAAMSDGAGKGMTVGKAETAEEADAAGEAEAA